MNIIKLSNFIKKYIQYEFRELTSVTKPDVIVIRKIITQTTEPMSFLISRGIIKKLYIFDFIRPFLCFI